MLWMRCVHDTAHTTRTPNRDVVQIPTRQIMIIIIIESTVCCRFRRIRVNWIQKEKKKKYEKFKGSGICFGTMKHWRWQMGTCNTESMQRHNNETQHCEHKVVTVSWKQRKWRTTEWKIHSKFIVLDFDCSARVTAYPRNPHRHSTHIHTHEDIFVAFPILFCCFVCSLRRWICVYFFAQKAEDFQNKSLFGWRREFSSRLDVRSTYVDEIRGREGGRGGGERKRELRSKNSHTRRTTTHDNSNAMRVCVCSCIDTAYPIMPKVSASKRMRIWRARFYGGKLYCVKYIGLGSTTINGNFQFVLNSVSVIRRRQWRREGG